MRRVSLKHYVHSSQKKDEIYNCNTISNTGTLPTYQYYGEIRTYHAAKQIKRSRPIDSDSRLPSLGLGEVPQISNKPPFITIVTQINMRYAEDSIQYLTETTYSTWRFDDHLHGLSLRQMMSKNMIRCVSGGVLYDEVLWAQRYYEHILCYFNLLTSLFSLLNIILYVTS